MNGKRKGNPLQRCAPFALAEIVVIALRILFPETAVRPPGIMS